MRLTGLSFAALVCTHLLACSGGGSAPAGAGAGAGEPAGASPAAEAGTGTGAEPGPAVETGADAAAKPSADADAAAAELARKREAAKAKIAAAPDELAARRQTMLTALNEGRRLVKAGDLDGGIAKYEALLKIDPHYGPALGELGWAEFKAGRLDDASAHTLRALAVATQDNKRGMLLYNLGRVAEQRGDLPAAAEYYRRSLERRANDTVAARLAGLDPSASAEPPRPTDAPALAGLEVIGRDLADLDAACSAAKVDALCVPDSCDTDASPDGRDDVAMLIGDDSGMIICYQPMIRAASGWTVFGPALIGQWGSEVSEDVDALTARVVRNDAGEFAVFEFEHHIYERGWPDELGDEDEDEAIPEEASTESSGVVVCKLGPTPACTPAIATKYEYWGFGDERISYAASWSLDGDTLTIAAVRESGDAASQLDDWDTIVIVPEGEYSLAELAAARG